MGKISDIVPKPEWPLWCMLALVSLILSRITIDHSPLQIRWFSVAVFDWITSRIRKNRQEISGIHPNFELISPKPPELHATKFERNWQVASKMHDAWRPSGLYMKTGGILEDLRFARKGSKTFLRRLARAIVCHASSLQNLIERIPPNDWTFYTPLPDDFKFLIKRLQSSWCFTLITKQILVLSATKRKKNTWKGSLG